jgi:hypothetical protein
MSDAGVVLELGGTDGFSAKGVALASPSGLGRLGVGGHPCQGVYYTPRGNDRPSVAFIAAHQNVDFSEHYLGPLLARCGFGFLGWNTRFRGDEAHFLTDHAIADIGAGAKWLRSNGVETLILLGNSGGGSLMAAYQSQAVEPSIEPAPGLQLSRGLDDLPTGDLYISLAAHPGRAHLFATTMDPSVVNEHDPVAVDSSLDMYDPVNGPPYSAEFISTYREAQLSRNRGITRWALERLASMQQSTTPASDQLFVTYRLWANLAFLDPKVEPNNRTLGTCWVGPAHRANFGIFGLGQFSSLRTWVNMWSVDFSQTRGDKHLPKISQPALVVNADADTGIFPSDARLLHDWLGSSDKTLLSVAGDHYFQQPDNARDELVDVICGWVRDHL